jgi:hypothetical protein
MDSYSFTVSGLSSSLSILWSTTIRDQLRSTKETRNMRVFNISVFVTFERYVSYINNSHTFPLNQTWLSISTLASYSVSPGFKSRPEDRLPSLRDFVVFLNYSQQIPGQHLKLGHDRFLPHTSHWKSWSSGWHSYFVFWRCRVPISAQRPPIPTEVFCGLSPSMRMLG